MNPSSGDPISSSHWFHAGGDFSWPSASGSAGWFSCCLLLRLQIPLALFRSCYFSASPPSSPSPVLPPPDLCLPQLPLGSRSHRLAPLFRLAPPARALRRQLLARGPGALLV